jgi:hypothetical protein
MRDAQTSSIIDGFAAAGCAAYLNNSPESIVFSMAIA